MLFPIVPVHCSCRSCLPDGHEWHGLPTAWRSATLVCSGIIIMCFCNQWLCFSKFFLKTLHWTGCQCAIRFSRPGPALENPWLDMDAMMVPPNDNGWEAAMGTSATLSLELKDFESLVIRSAAINSEGFDNSWQVFKFHSSPLIFFNDAH